MEAAMERWNTLAPEDIITVTFIWRIYNFSTLSKGKKYSNIFITDDTGDYQWRVLVYPKGNFVDHMSAYLDVAGASELPLGWSRLARFKLTVRNELDRRRSITKETVHIFDKNDSDWGFTSLIPLTVLNDHTQGYLVNDTCVIEANVSVPKAVTTLANEASSSAPVQHLGGEVPMNAEPTHADSPVVKEEPFLSSLPSGVTSNFRGFGEIDNTFVPLLEEVCSLHPSLVESMQDQGEQFTQWAFTTLGRLLYFLNTGEPQKLTEQSRRDLRKLWEELQVFKFDLSWVEEDFITALGMKDEAERAKKLREEMNTLDTQRKRLKAELAAVEVNFEEAQHKAADIERLIDGGSQYRTKLLEPPS
ncbi:hypothetical protein ACLB2K_026123 [Fragaria x ananassa]